MFRLVLCVLHTIGRLFCILSDKFPMCCGAGCRGPWGFDNLAMVLRHLKSILTFVFLNMFVTLHVWREMYVNMAHICSCPCVLWCVLSYVLSGAEAFVFMPVGKHYVGLCVELLSILFVRVLN